MSTVKCLVCGDETNKRRKNRFGKYCSRECYSIDRLTNKENNPNWKDGSGVTNYSCQVAYRKRYPERRNAREKVYRAIKTGKMSKLPCSKCGHEKAEAHHKYPNTTIKAKPAQMLYLAGLLLLI